MFILSLFWIQSEKLSLFWKDLIKEKFANDQKSQSAVILHLTLIGENSKKISEDTKSKIDSQWKEIAGFRDIAIHDYINLNSDTNLFLQEAMVNKPLFC